ncbi:MAG TPA: cobalamin-dependent protein, partial [Candidatus Omnitrophota bacterium]|nr:cobalamin-dependent protein [Candidatus Omnitrophota bacterium]
MFDVIFINPLDKKEEGKEFFSLFSRLKKIRLLPPLGLAYLASFLREAGFKVKIIDANALRLNQEDLRRIIASDKPKIVAVTSTTPVFNSSLNVCKLVKDIDTKIITVMGGVHITVMPFETLQFHSCIDYGIIRDGEIPLLELTKRLIKKADVSGIPGLVYRDANVNVRLNPNDTLIDDLDKIPFPAWDMLPVERYFDVTCKSYHTVSLVSSRGCPFKCAFCERDVRGGHLRKRSAGNFVDEIELLLKNYGFKELLFYDDTFTVDKKRVIEICAEIKKRKLSFHWDCRTRSDMISPEIAKLMKEAGCRRISLGIESADQKVLNALN